MLITRKIELLDGMIETYKSHAERCDNIPNRVMAQKQKAWDLERVALLEELKSGMVAGAKTRQQIACDESTRYPIFLFQTRTIARTGIPCGYGYDDDYVVVKRQSNDDPDDPQELSDEEMLRRDCAIEYWETETVFATREEGNECGKNKAYNYPNGWRVYCVPCEGSLKHILEEAVCEKIKVRTRGIGREFMDGCYVCGGGKSLYNNISVFVEGKTDGEKVVVMFGRGAYLDYRDSEPGWIQVKIGACDGHLRDLGKLNGLIVTGVISKQIIEQSKALE